MYRVIPEELFYDEGVGDRAKLLYMELAYLGSKGTIPDMVRARFGGNRIDILMDQLKGYIKKYNHPSYEIETSGVVVEREEKEEKKATRATKDVVDEILSHFNETFKPNRDVRPTKNIKSMLNARLAVFSKDDIKDAISNRYAIVSNNEWYNTEDGRRHKNRYDIILRDDESVQKCLLADIPNKSKSTSTVNEIDISVNDNFLE